MIGMPKFCVAIDCRPRVKISLSGCSVDGFYHLPREFGQFLTTKNADGRRILSVG